MRKSVCLMVVLAWQAMQVALPAPADGLAPLPGDTRPVRYKLAVKLDAPASRYFVQSTVDFEVLKTTQRVVVHARDLKLDSVRLAAGDAAQISYDTARQQATFAFAHPLAPGRHQLQIAYSGSIGEEVEGLFKVRYPSLSGGEKQMFFTHLCCIATGRRFMPQWDQPDLKAVFELELTVPAGLDAVSNMPVAKRDSLPGGWSRFTFQPTPRMSSYLLFFGAGEFDRITAAVGSTEIGVITQRGKAQQGRFALQSNAEVLGFYNEYFGTPYPLPKLDSVTFPGAGSFGAMENWGAIFYFEPYLLLDPALSTEQDRQEIFTIVAHEVSHQWFGDLVTMRSWDDLWLNEGFASWMETKASYVFHPDWNRWLHASESRESAMRLDARASTHPIVRNVKTLEEAELAFDDITYEKGSQVIRMIESYVGEEPFRAAIRQHMRSHAYGNAITRDLWQELEATSPQPVTAIARDFTEQGGVPLIDVLSTQCIPEKNETRVLLRQGRFGLDEASKQPRAWHVPVTAGVLGGDRITHQIVHGGGTATLNVAGCGPVKVNMGESGYFRTRYDAHSFTQLEQSFGGAVAADQLGLLNDSFNLSEAGYQSMQSYLQLATHLMPSSDPVVLLQFVRSVLALDHLYSGLSSQERYRVFARSKLSGLLREVGWTAHDGEHANVSILRAELIQALARLADGPTLTEARRRFAGAATDPALTPADIRKAVVNAVGSGADTAMFEELKARAFRSEDTTEKRVYLLAAARATDSDTARRVLELALTDAVPEQLSPNLILAVAEVHPGLAFDFVVQHFDAVAQRLDSFARIDFVPRIAANGVDRVLAQKLATFAAKSIGAAGRETVERSRSLIVFGDEVRHRSLPQVDEWLGANK